MKKRLQTILAHSGVASRRHSASLIEEGKVKIDGRVVLEKGFRVDPEEHEISVQGKLLAREEKKFYFLFNKPKDTISTVSDSHGRVTVTDYFKNIKARLYPVGRLDKDTTGVLIITNDGDMAHRLAHPSFEVEKEYRVTVKDPVDKDTLEKMKEGIRIDGKKTTPCEITRDRKSRDRVVYKMRIHEGRKRQIRRMFADVGSKGIDLKRNKYAGITLGRLTEGEYRELTKEEVIRLKKLEMVKNGTGQKKS